MKPTPETTGERLSSRLVIKKDPVINHIKTLGERVGSLEEEALRATSSRWETVGLAAAQLGIGGASLSDAVFHTINFWPGSNPDLIGVVISSYVLIRGLANAGTVPERFRRARQLTHDSHMLRASLTNAYEEAIQDIPYKQLETNSS